MCVSIGTAMLISTVASVGMGIAQMAMAPDPPRVDSVPLPGVEGDTGVQEAEQETQEALATTIKSRKNALRAGIVSPTSLTGPGGISDDELNLGSNRLI